MLQPPMIHQGRSKPSMKAAIEVGSSGSQRPYQWRNSSGGRRPAEGGWAAGGPVGRESMEGECTGGWSGRVSTTSDGAVVAGVHLLVRALCSLTSPLRQMRVEVGEHAAAVGGERLVTGVQTVQQPLGHGELAQRLGALEQSPIRGGGQLLLVGSVQLLEQP